jgi:hypothetical protein
MLECSNGYSHRRGAGFKFIWGLAARLRCGLIGKDFLPINFEEGYRGARSANTQG